MTCGLFRVILIESYLLCLFSSLELFPISRGAGMGTGAGERVIRKKWAS
jgi:hypothetical protein